jgi:hypothetical protein
MGHSQCRCRGTGRGRNSRRGRGAGRIRRPGPIPRRRHDAHLLRLRRQQRHHRPRVHPVPGTNPSVFAQGDELIINDQLTTTHKVGSGYPIVGHDAGVCTLTRIPEPHAAQTLADCAATAVLPGGSLTIQGVLAFQAQQPQPTVLAVTGGTGRFAGAAGTVAVTFTKNYKILTITLT